MFKRIIALALCLVLALGMVPAVHAHREPVVRQIDQCNHTLRVDAASPDYSRPAYDGYLIDITPQRVEDHFRYLDEIYIERHPEAALVVNTGTRQDQEMLKTLAETITADCATDTEKANAIDRWLFRNIYYDVNTSAYASDTFLDRTGNCLSYANLMQFLLRSLGIPAVVGDGWRGDMKTSTVDLFNYEGHAWCFVYLEGEWVLYDPLWIECGTTDRSYIAEWIYLDTIEFITPAYDGENLPPEAYDKPKVYYSGGVFYNYNDGAEMGYGNFTQFVNNQGYNFTTNQDEWETDGPYDGWVYVDGRDETTMRRGEVYRDGWISYGDYLGGTHIKLTYAHPNGMQIDGAVMEYDGKQLYMARNNAYPILADEEDYTIRYGTMTFKSDYVGPFIGEYWGDSYDTADHFVVWESLNPEIATVDENGILTAVAPGWAEIKVQLIREEVWEGNVDYAYLSTSYIDVQISDEVRVPDYSDLPIEHECEWIYSNTTNPTCEDWGYDIYECTQCSATTKIPTLEPFGHEYVVMSIIRETCTEPAYIYYSCTRCAHVDVQTGSRALGHNWKGTVCTRCSATRLTPFDDVVIDSFYEAPVAWAVAEGITNGISATEFGPTAVCNRAQVVTFLWRAVGSPEPESTGNPFVDVAAGSFYEKPVLWAVENGITNGTDATHFGPGNPCNRATVVTFMWRAAGQPEPESTDVAFTDVPAGTWFTKPVLWAVENGVTNGLSAAEFGPNAACNRAQVVTFLWRAFA